MKMKTTMTPQQAITLYNTIEALMNQFDRDNDPKVPHSPRYVCWVCKEEQTGNPAYTSKAINGDFHYCYKCWNAKPKEAVAMTPPDKSTCGQTGVA